jgi:hypothetical protein
MSAEAKPARSLLKRLPIYPALKQLGHYPDYWWWKLRGEPRRIPHIIKQRTVIEYAQRFGLDTLVETGTYYGEMIAAVASRFRRVYSIELDPTLAAKARERFRHLAHITILSGDSQSVVPRLLQELNQACLWWLDAGYCEWAGETSSAGRLGSEIHAVLADVEHDHVILMDDADGVVGLDELIASIRSRYPNRDVEVARNIIRVTPRKP